MRLRSMEANAYNDSKKLGFSYSHIYLYICIDKYEYKYAFTIHICTYTHHEYTGWDPQDATPPGNAYLR